MYVLGGELPPGVARVSPRATLASLAALLVQRNIDTFIVVEGDTIVGVLRARDVVAALTESTPPEAPAESRPAPAASPATTPALTLKLRRMETGEKLYGEFASLDDAERWLRERPLGIEVLGVVQPVLSSEEEHRLHVAMRPKNDAERALERAHDEAEARHRRAELDALQAEAMQELSVQFSAEPDAERPPKG